jgi:hypothetical protein
MQQRIHQAFYRSKLACWDRCKKEHDEHTLQSARLECVSQQCFEPAREADHQLADSAGLAYEQARKLTLDMCRSIAAIIKFSQRPECHGIHHSDTCLLADADGPAHAGRLWRGPA